MNSTPPFVAQERPDTCAIACLRMILAQRGKQVSEADILRFTDLSEGGLTPAEVSHLAKQFGLQATEQQVNHKKLLELINGGLNPIAFLYRKAIDRVDMIHAVIPIRYTRSYIAILDPLHGERRVLTQKFKNARRLVGEWVVICH